MGSSELTHLISNSLYIDAHCHGCDFPHPPSLMETLERERILCLNAASDPESIRKAAELNRNCPRILSAAGIHPWQAGTFSLKDLEELAPFYREAQQISEIGMDAVWAPPEAGIDKQEILFRAQLELARRLEKPATLHTKGTEDRILELLEARMPPAVLIHWFDGNDAQLRRFLNLGCFFSVSPAVINTPRQREICLRIPEGKLLAETDNPSTWPWLLGSEAKEEQIREVYSALSTLLHISEDDLGHSFRENLRAFIRP